MFYSPWYFLLLLLVPVIAWRLFAPRRRSAVRFSSLKLAQQISPTLRQRLTWLPGALTLAAIVFLILGMARPREGREQTIAESEGIAIEMVVDRSGSMQAMDFQVDGEHVDRLTAIKKVAGNFVTGDKRPGWTIQRSGGTDHVRRIRRWRNTADARSCVPGFPAEQRSNRHQSQRRRHRDR